MMKKGYLRIEALIEAGLVVQPVRRNPFWQIGFWSFLLGNIAVFGSLALIAQTMAAALSSVQFISNLFCGKFLFGEYQARKVWIATFYTILGNVIIVVFSNKNSVIYDQRMLIEFYYSAGIIAYLCIITVCEEQGLKAYQSVLSPTVVVWIFSTILLINLTKFGKKDDELIIKFSNQFGCIQDSSNDMSIYTIRHRILLACMIIFCVGQVAVSSLSTVMGKSLVTLFVSGIANGGATFRGYLIYVCFAVMVICTIHGVIIMDKGLKLYPAQQFLLVKQIVQTIFSILSGAIYFQEFQNGTTISIVMFVVGALTMLIGVYYIVSGKAQEYYVLEDLLSPEQRMTLIQARAIKQQNQDQRKSVLFKLGNQSDSDQGDLIPAIRQSEVQRPRLTFFQKVKEEFNNLDLQVSVFGLPVDKSTIKARNTVKQRETIYKQELRFTRQTRIAQQRATERLSKNYQKEKIDGMIVSLNASRASLKAAEIHLSSQSSSEIQGNQESKVTNFASNQKNIQSRVENYSQISLNPQDFIDDKYKNSRFQEAESHNISQRTSQQTHYSFSTEITDSIQDTQKQHRLQNMQQQLQVSNQNISSFLKPYTGLEDNNQAKKIKQEIQQVKFKNTSQTNKMLDTQNYLLSPSFKTLVDKQQMQSPKHQNTISAQFYTQRTPQHQRSQSAQLYKQFTISPDQRYRDIVDEQEQVRRDQSMYMRGLQQYKKQFQ